jgi:hypothetical protein
MPYKLQHPTIKQKKAIKLMVENGGNVSRAMIDAGYSPATAKNPQKLAKSKTWNELMDQYFPEDLLTKVQEEGLRATRVISAVNTNKDANGATTDFIEVPDYPTRHKYLETGLKLRKKLTDRVDFTSGDKPIPILQGIINVIHSNNSDEKTGESK